MADLDGLTRVEGGVTGVIVGGVKEELAAPALHRGGARLDGSGHGAEDDVVVAGQDVGAIEAEDARAATVGLAAAEAVGGTGGSRAEAGADRGRRARGDRADEVARADLGDTAAVIVIPETAEEGLATTERALVDVQVIADRVDGDDGRVRTAGVSIVSREGGHRADVAEADDGETGLVAGDRQAAADVAAGKMETGARVDRDGARAERGIRARADVEAGEDTLVDGDRAGHRARAGNEGESAVAELLERAGTADRAFQEDGVDAGSGRLGLEPSSLIERGRPREHEALGERQHRRVGGTALTRGESQRTKTRSTGRRTVAERRVVEDRDVVEEVDVIGIYARSAGIHPAASQDKGDLIDRVGGSGISARTEVGGEAHGELTLVDGDRTREQRSRPGTGVDAVHGDLTGSSLGQVGGVDGTGEILPDGSTGGSGIKNGLAGPGSAEDPVVGVRTAGGGGEDHAGGLACGGRSADGDGEAGTRNRDIAHTEGLNGRSGGQGEGGVDVDLLNSGRTLK